MKNFMLILCFLAIGSQAFGQKKAKKFKKFIAETENYTAFNQVHKCEYKAGLPEISYADVVEYVAMYPCANCRYYSLGKITYEDKSYAHLSLKVDGDKVTCNLDNIFKGFIGMSYPLGYIYMNDESGTYFIGNTHPDYYELISVNKRGDKEVIRLSKESGRWLNSPGS